jgi:hypothetical protein
MSGASEAVGGSLFPRVQWGTGTSVFHVRLSDSAAPSVNPISNTSEVWTDCSASGSRRLSVGQKSTLIIVDKLKIRICGSDRETFELRFLPHVVAKYPQAGDSQDRLFMEVTGGAKIGSSADRGTGVPPIIVYSLIGKDVLSGMGFLVEHRYVLRGAAIHLLHLRLACARSTALSGWSSQLGLLKCATTLLRM